MRKLELCTAVVAAIVVLSTSASAGTVNEYVRVWGSDDRSLLTDYYFKTFTNDLKHWACGTTPSGGDKNCYSYTGGPISIHQIRVHIYPTNEVEYSYNNWWWWEQSDGYWTEDGQIQKYIGEGSFVDDWMLEGYWAYRNGHYTYRGEIDWPGMVALQYWMYTPYMYCPNCLLYYPIEYPLMAVSYRYPTNPSTDFQRYFYVERGAHQ